MKYLKLSLALLCLALMCCYLKGIEGKSTSTAIRSRATTSSPRVSSRFKTTTTRAPRQTTTTRVPRHTTTTRKVRLTTTAAPTRNISPTKLPSRYYPRTTTKLPFGRYPHNTTKLSFQHFPHTTPSLPSSLYIHPTNPPTVIVQTVPLASSKPKSKSRVASINDNLEKIAVSITKINSSLKNDKPKKVIVINNNSNSTTKNVNDKNKFKKTSITKNVKSAVKTKFPLPSGGFVYVIKEIPVYKGDKVRPGFYPTDAFPIPLPYFPKTDLLQYPYTAPLAPFPLDYQNAVQFEPKKITTIVFENGKTKGIYCTPVGVADPLSQKINVFCYVSYIHKKDYDANPFLIQQQQPEQQTIVKNVTQSTTSSVTAQPASMFGTYCVPVLMNNPSNSTVVEQTYCFDTFMPLSQNQVNQSALTTPISTKGEQPWSTHQNNISTAVLQNFNNLTQVGITNSTYLQLS